MERQHRLRSPFTQLAWAALLSLSCGSPTGVDRSASVDVSAVSVDPPASTLMLGAEVPLRAAVMDANGNVVPGAPVVWTVRDADVASISATGVVTGRAVGSTQVAASAGGRSAVATITVQLPPVGSVVVQPGTVALTSGSTTTLAAVVADVKGTPAPDRAVRWTTSDALVAVVSAGGAVTAVGPGSATITAESEGKTGTATVTVSPASAASVTVEPASITLQVGRSSVLTATAKDASDNVLPGRTAAWSTSNVNVATVSATGNVTAVSAGTATISATIDGRSGTSTVTVTPAPPAAVASVVVQPSPLVLRVGGSRTITAVPKDADGNALTGRVVTWASGNALVVKVVDNGNGTAVVTGLATGGPVTITARCEGSSGTTAITVTPVPVGSVTLPPTATLVAGQSVTLTPVVKDTNDAVLTGRVISWKSSNEAVATVTATATGAVVKSLTTGQATITATSEEGVTGRTVLTVTPAPVGSVTVLPSAPTLISGSTATFTATVKDVNGTTVSDRPVIWKSSNEAVATVSSSGSVTTNVTGLKAGTAKIIATSESKADTATVTVVAGPAATVNVAPTAVTLRDGASVQLTATATDARGNVITGRPFLWSSSDDSRATVSTTGRVTAKRAGLTPITITAKLDNATDTSQITVTP